MGYDLLVYEAIEMLAKQLLKASFKKDDSGATKVLAIRILLNENNSTNLRAIRIFLVINKTRGRLGYAIRLRYFCGAKD